MGKLTHTVKGPIASFRSADVAPIESLKLHFLPKQEGSGDPSPTNIRPITGWTGCNLTHSGTTIPIKFPVIGKNMLNPVATNVIPFDIAGYSNYTLNNGIVTTTGKTFIGFKVKVNPSTTYTFSFNTSSSVLMEVAAYETEPTVINFSDLFLVGRTISSQDFTTPSNCEWVVCGFYITDSGITIRELMLELGSTGTQYEPYSYIYGGYVDLTNGQLVSEYAKVILNGNVTIYSIRNEITAIRAYIKKENWISEEPLGNIGTLFSYMTTDNAQSSPWCGWIDVTSASNPSRLFLRFPPQYNTEALIKQYLSENPLEIVYKIQPITYQLTPQQLKTLLDYNIFWTDMNDDTEVTYEFADRLSERKLILNTPHIETAAGSTASFTTDLRAPLTKLKVDITPSQSGSGDPSPTNVRPITGITGLTLTHSGDSNYSETYPLSWESNGTLYYGYVNILTGEVYKTGNFLHFQPNYIQGVFNNNSNGTAPYLGISAVIANIQPTSLIICSDKLKRPNRDEFGYYDEFVACIAGDSRLMIGLPQELNTLNAVRSWMTDIGGFDVVYPISTPTLVTTLDPISLKSLIGQNNIFADTNGNVDVKYWTH